jgi:arylsulfatase A-like enzyme
MIENIDDNFGVLLARLKEWNAFENTLVIFMTDNGMAIPRNPINRNGVEELPFNAHLKGYKNSPHEGGTHVPAFWYWKGVLGEGVDIDGLTAHIDLYKTFSDLAGVHLPEQMQALSGRSLLPLLMNPDADWPDREHFVHSGRWNPGERDNAQYVNCAVRTQQWRFVNNEELYDIPKDPYETKDLSALYPEVISKLQASYNSWWEATLPFLVNEGLPIVKPEDQPLTKRYYLQLNSEGIPEYNPCFKQKYQL